MKLRNNLKAQLIYRIIWVLVALTGTIIAFVIYNKDDAGGNISPFLFYTNWSVFLATIVSITSLASTIMQLDQKKREGNNEMIPLLKFSANIMIVATFIVSAFVLPDKIWTIGYWNVGSIFKHFLLPILTIVDACLFDRKNSYRISYPFFAVILPLIYWVVLIIRFCVKRNSCGGTIPEITRQHYYPYGFTDLDAGHTLGGLIGLLAGILVGLIVIGFIFFFFNRVQKDENGKLKLQKLDESSMTDIIHFFGNRNR